MTSEEGSKEPPVSSRKAVAPPAETSAEEKEEVQGEVDPLSREISPLSGLHRKYPAGPAKPTP